MRTLLVLISFLLISVMQPVQAQAAGRPVIAFAGGGALDTVNPGKTGELFQDMTVDSLAAVMQAFDASAYDPAAIRAHAEQFDTQVFNRQMTEFVEQAWEAFQANRKQTS